METKGFAVQRAAILARADIESNLIPELSYRPAGAEKEKEWNVHAPMKKLVRVGFVYAVPVWMDFTYTTKVKFKAEANIAATLRFGWSRNASLSAGASYVKDASPRVSWSRNATVSPLAVEPISLSLAFTVPATQQAVSVALGGSLNLEGTASGGDGPIFYQWLHNGILIPGKTSRQLVIPNVTSGNAGTYTLRARAGTETLIAPAFTVTTHNSGTPLGGFAYIPAGSFEMGDQSNPLVGESYELPVHTVQVSGFYMGKTEVTWLDWRTVRDWAVTQNYTDLSGRGAGKADTYPVHSITWYDMVKWCNAKSEKEGLTPCYSVSGATYRSGQNDAVVCNWGANGYRLPTEAEWEKAARGGVTGKNFPWGADTITHSQANYYSSSSYAYDTSPTRVIRGGSWNNNANHARCANAPGGFAVA